jgi:predicted Co/Zn/Cd cation transporter (cation efflux family)
VFSFTLASRIANFNVYVMGRKEMKKLQQEETQKTDWILLGVIAIILIISFTMAYLEN